MNQLLEFWLIKLRRKRSITIDSRAMIKTLRNAKDNFCAIGLHDNKIIDKQILRNSIHVVYECRNKNCKKISCDITKRGVNQNEK